MKGIWFSTKKFHIIVIAALVAAIHRGASVIYPDNSTRVERWIAGMNRAMTIAELK